MESCTSMGIFGRTRFKKGVCGKGLHPKDSRGRCAECHFLNQAKRRYARRLTEFWVKRGLT